MKTSQSLKRPLIAVVLMWALVALLVLPRPARANVSGAIYTTNVDASMVNQNLYDNKDDVYLSGGPRPPSCSSPGLQDGTYYFQVTDPSGATLLSSDPLDCRIVTVTNGVVTAYSPTGVSCTGHLTGIPIENCGENPPQITVQLSPYDDTPNNGGVYKLWMTPVGDVAAGCDPTTTGAGCFVDANSKTDNFRVKSSTPPELTAEIDIFKFCDANANGVLDPSELLLGLNGWSVSAVGSDSCSGTTGSGGNPTGTLVCGNLAGGTYDVSETLQGGFSHTATCTGGACGSCAVSMTPCNFDSDCPLFMSNPADTCTLFDGLNPITVTAPAGAITEVDFGNISKGSISGSKLDDTTNAPIQNMKVVLTGTQTVDGATVNLCTVTAADGSYSFPNLLAGTYIVTEMPPAGVIPITATTCMETLTLDGTCAVSSATCDAFRNACLGAGGGLTLGFWSNKNGQKLETLADFSLLTSLNLVNADGSARDFSGTLSADKTALSNWLLAANATNMANMLSAQLAAMKLNVAHGFVSGSALVFAGTNPGCTDLNGVLSATGFITVSNLMSAANSELGEPGGNLTVAAGIQRTCEEFKKNALDAANNNQNFKVPCPSENFGQSCGAQAVSAVRKHKKHHHGRH